MLSAALIMVWCLVGLFFVSGPQQLLMVKVGEGGGEAIGFAYARVALNAGSAPGALIARFVLNTGAAYASSTLSGASFALAAVVYSRCLLWRASAAAAFSFAEEKWKLPFGAQELRGMN